MRTIDADSLKENIEYALLQHEDAEKWLEWINQVIDAEPTVEDTKDRIKTENMSWFDRCLSLIVTTDEKKQQIKKRKIRNVL